MSWWLHLDWEGVEDSISDDYCLSDDRAAVEALAPQINASDSSYSAYAHEGPRILTIVELVANMEDLFEPVVREEHEELPPPPVPAPKWTPVPFKQAEPLDEEAISRVDPKLADVLATLVPLR